MTWFVSASQIDTYLECPRKWAWQKIAGLEGVAGGAAVLGSEVHTQLEHWLRDGRPLDFTTNAGYVAAVIQPLLPRPKTPGMLVEETPLGHTPPPGGKGDSFRFQRGDNLFYLGKRDFVIPWGSLMPAGNKGWFDGCLVESTSHPVVGDHKTSSNIRRYAKSAEKLLWDTAANIYAYWTMAEYKTPTVDLHWNYGDTRTHKAEPVRQRMQVGHVSWTMQSIDVVAREINALIETKPNPLSLTPRSENCGKYGGCPFQGQCNLAPHERKKPSMNNEPDLLEMLRNRTATGDKPPADGPQVPEKPDAAGAVAALLSGVIVPAPEVTVSGVIHTSGGDIAIGAGATGINPPEATTDVPAGVAPTAVVKAKAPTKAELAAELAALKASMVPTTKLTEAIQEAVKTDAPVQVNGFILPKGPAFIADPGPVPWEDNRGGLVGPTIKGFALLVGALPVKFPGYTAMPWAEAMDLARGRVTGKSGATDWRMLDFKGSAVFVSSWVDLMSEGAFNGRALMVPASDHEARLFLSVAENKADFVIRGCS